MGCKYAHASLCRAECRSPRGHVPHPDVRLDVDGVVLFQRDMEWHEAPGTTAGPEAANSIPVQRRQTAIVPGTTMLVGATFPIRPPAWTCIRKERQHLPDHGVHLPNPGPSTNPR
jgi:hypothetical protein